MIGTANPVYVIKASVKIAVNGRAWKMVREHAPTVRKNMESARVTEKENSRKIKNAEGSRRKSVRKYITILNPTALTILNGMSHNAEDTASAKG